MDKVKNLNAIGLYSFSQKLKGLLNTSPNGNTYALYNCNSVHTVGMKHPLDIAFIDSCGKVLQVYMHIPAGFKIKCREANVTLERFSSMHKNKSWLEKGQIVKLVSENINLDKEKEISYEKMSSM